MMALAALLLCTQSACRRTADTANLAIVDSLMLTTDSLITGMNALDLAAVDSIDSLFSLKKETLVARMRDTLKKDDALVLGNYHRTMTKAIARVKGKHAPTLNDLTISRRQLADLRNDVEKGLLEPAVEAKYISDEKMSLAKARQTAETVAASVQSVLRDQSRYGPAVDSLLANSGTPDLP